MIMVKLLPHMFHGFVKNDVWKALSELSYFYSHLCAKKIKQEILEMLVRMMSMVGSKMLILLQPQPILEL
jgi:hypothetical protein